MYCKYGHLKTGKSCKECAKQRRLVKRRELIEIMSRRETDYQFTQGETQ